MKFIWVHDVTYEEKIARQIPVPIMDSISHSFSKITQVLRAINIIEDSSEDENDFFTPDVKAKLCKSRPSPKPSKQENRLLGGTSHHIHIAGSKKSPEEICKHAFFPMMNNKGVNPPKAREVEQNPGKAKTKDDIKPTAMESHEVVYENLDVNFQKRSHKTFTALNFCITGDISCNVQEMKIHENDLSGKKIIQDTDIDTKLSIICPEAELYFISIETSSDPQKGKNELLCKEKSKMDLKSNTSGSSISKPHRMMLNKTFLYPNPSFNSNRHPTPKAFTSSLQRSFTKANNIVRAKNVLEELKEEDCDDDDFYSKGNLKNLLT